MSEHRKPKICAGCNKPIEPGQEVPVLIEAANHAITVSIHEGHYDAAKANTLARSDWKRNDSFLTK